MRGEVRRGAPLGDLHLAPWPVHVDEPEQVRGTIATVLAVITPELAGSAAHLADKLDWAFVEANYWPLRIWRLSVEIEDILHAGDVVRVDLGNAPHVLTPRLEIVLGQTSTHGLAR
jgi:hypothetical protein